MLSVSKEGQPTVDILLINKLRRLILFDSYAWDECLTGAASMVRNNYSEALRTSSSKVMGRDFSLEKLGDEKEKSIASSNDSLPQDAEYDKSLKKGKSFSDISGKGVIPEDVGSDKPSESSEGVKKTLWSLRRWLKRCFLRARPKQQQQTYLILLMQHG